MSAVKLQKLCYYSHAWHLAWDGVPLFTEPIHAWANGPAIPALYEMHKGQYWVVPGLFRHHQETKAARITVVYDRDAQCYHWAVPDVVFGGLRTGSHHQLSAAVDEGRSCIQTMYTEGREMLHRSAESLAAAGHWDDDWHDSLDQPS